MDALTYIETKFGLTRHARPPIEIPNTNRETLARLFFLLGFQSGAEIGVEQGLYSEVLCRENPWMRHLLCVDPWKAYRGYRDHVSQEKLDGFYNATRQRLALYSGVQIVRQTSMDAVRAVPDGSLDFVYLDGNHHFQHVTNDIVEWSKKVRPGGIIAGHDYVKYRWPNQIHVLQVVNAYTDALEIRPWFLLGTQAKVPGELRDTARSWFWVQPEPRSVRKRRGVVKQ